MVQDEYREHGTIVEKYDVVRRASDIDGDLRFGYRSNEVGFGWTKGVFTLLLDELSPSDRRAVSASNRR